VGFSKLSDIYGRKNMLAIAWLLFTLGSVWCGIARRMGELYARCWFCSPAVCDC
jgi:MFS family permease